jgi:hypothetical protein
LVVSMSKLAPKAPARPVIAGHIVWPRAFVAFT